MSNQEVYALELKAFESEEAYNDYINLSNKIDAVCTQVKILDTVLTSNKYVEATLDFCDNKGDINNVVKVFSPALKDSNGEREIFATINSKIVRLGVESAFEAGGTRLGQLLGSAIVGLGAGTPPAWIMGTATGGAFYLGGKYIGVAVGHYTEKAAYDEFLEFYDAYIKNDDVVTQNPPDYIDTKTNEKIIITPNSEINQLEPTLKVELDTNKIIPLTKGQTISHIAQNTPYNSIELLEYNNLTLEDAKNLPVGFEVKIPKEVTSLESVDGTIKFYENQDGGGIAFVPSPDGKVYLEYEQGDFFSSSPDKVSFGNETWTKGVDGVLFKSEVKTDDYTIVFEQDDNGNSIISDINITGTTDYETIAQYTNYSAQDLQAFNLSDSSAVQNGANITLPASKEPSIEGGYGDITHFLTNEGESIFIVPNVDGTTTTYATFTDGFENQASYTQHPDGSMEVILSNSDGSDRVIISNPDGYNFDSYGLDNNIDFSYATNEQGYNVVSGLNITEPISYAQLVDSGLDFNIKNFAILNGLEVNSVFDLETLPKGSYILPDDSASFSVPETDTTVVKSLGSDDYIVTINTGDTTEVYSTKNDGLIATIDNDTGTKIFSIETSTGREEIAVKGGENVAENEQTIYGDSSSGLIVGGIVGGQIGSLINANNNFSNLEKILVTTATTTIGQIAGSHIGPSDSPSTSSDSNSSSGGDSALESNLKGAVASFAVSAYFAKNDNISDWIGADGTFGGDMLDFAVSYVITSEVVAIIDSVTSSATYTAGDSLSWANFGNAVGGYIGNYLGNKVAESWIDTKEESMGGAIGSAVGAYVGAVAAMSGGALAAQFASFGAFAGPIGALIGAFIGVIAGSLLGGLFGGTPPPPEAQALFEFDEETGTYTLIASSSDNGGNEEALKNIGENFGKQLVNMFMIPGGQLTDANGMPDIYLNQVDQLVKLNEQNGSFDTVSDMMAKALSIQIPFINVEDGDPYILRAIHRTNDGFYEEGVNNDDNNASLEELYDNIELAQDYSKYMNEVMVIVDEDGRPIVDNELLQQINEEYQAISAIVDEAERNALMEAFTTKYIFTTYTQFVDTLLEEISDDDIQAYLDERATIEEDFNTQINSATQKLQAVENSLESIEQQLETLIEQYNYTSDKKAKEALETQINTLSEKESLLIQDKQTLTQEIPLLKQQKEETLTAFDDEHFKEIEAIHWNEVFEMAIELSLDEHHYSEDFNKINTQIAQYNYDEHEKNGELLDIDYDAYLKEVAQGALDVYKERLEEEALIQERADLLKADPKLELPEVEIADGMSKEEALDILGELGYNFELGYDEFIKSIPAPAEGQEIDIPTFEEFLDGDDVLEQSFDTVVEVTPERFVELLEMFDIANPYEGFVLAPDAFNLQNKDITDLQFELKDGNLIITTFDKDIDEDKAIEDSKQFVIQDWDKWDKEHTHIDLPNGTKMNLAALLSLIGVVEGEGAVDVEEAFNTLALNDEDLASYIDGFESDNILIGTSLDDRINAFFENNLIKAGEGNDEINTGAGDDVIIAGSGEDTIHASLGNDTVTYENSSSAVHANLKDGGTLGDAKGDSYDGVENLIGSAYDDYLIGDELDNTLIGNDGNDILNGGEGADHLVGGDGVDLVDYSDANDFVEINLEENTGFNSDAQGDTFEDIEGVRGSNFDDIIIGNNSDNLVYAQDGDDRIDTSGGNDIIYAGDGNDYVKAGDGNDEIYGGNGDDVLIGGSGNDTFYGGNGKNILLGDDGTDIVVYEGLSTQYEILFLNENTILVQSLDGNIKDTLKDIEEIAFDDAVFAIDYENRVLVKKAQFEVTEDIENEEDNVASDSNSTNNQAAAIATAAMIGTVATAETIESSSEEETVVTNNEIVEEDEEEEVIPNVEPIIEVNVLDENNILFDSVQKIIAFQQEQLAIVSINEDEDNTTVVEEKERDKKVDDLAVIDNSQEVVTTQESVVITNQDNDTNIQADEIVEVASEESIEEELPELLIPTINFDTTLVLEDSILSGLKITNPNPDSSLQVIISGIPDNMSLSAGEKWSDGDWHLTQADLQDIEIITSLDDANDFDVQITATVVDIHGRVIQNVLNETIVIEAVADTPNFEVENATVNYEDQYIDLNISTSLVDVIGGEDGEESIILSVENVPDDAILTAGSKDLDSGIWYLVPEDLEGLQVRAGTHVSDDFTVKVTSFTIESENNSIASISEEIFVEVIAVADTPNLVVSNASGDEDTQIPIDIVSTFVDEDLSEVLTVKIEGIPEGAVLSKGVKDGDGNWNLQRSELSNLFLTPALHDAQDFTMQVTARTTETENGDFAEITKEIDVTIDAIADSVTFDLTQELSETTEIQAEEDASITYLNIATQFIDQDGSESVHYVIDGLPSGATLNNGVEVESGKWELQVEDLENLGIFLKANSDKDFQLKISAITTESENGHQKTTVEYIDCNVESVADFADLEVTHTQGYQNNFIDLDIQSALTDKDGSETLEIIIEQVPENAVLSKGVKDSDGNWHLKAEDLNGLNIRPEFNSIEDIELKIRAITTESKNGDTQENTAYMNIKVNELPSNANLNVSATQINEDELCYLDIQIDETQMNSSDSIFLEVMIPSEFSLNQGVQVNETTWKLYKKDLDGLILNTPENYAGSFFVDIIPSIVTPEGEVKKSEIATKLPVDIEAVADEPTLEVMDITSNEDRLIYLNIESELVDLDGSETLLLELTGIPDDALLNVGTKQDDCTWIINEEDISLVAMLPAQNTSGVIELGVKAITTDSNGDSQEVLKNMTVTINEVLDTPNLLVVDSYIYNSEALLTINSNLLDQDSSETLEIIISNIPDGASLNQGTLNEDGSYTLNSGELENLKITGLTGSSFELNVEAKSNGLESTQNTVTVSAITDTYPLLFDSSDADYSNILETLNGLDENANVQIIIDGIPRKSSIEPATLNHDGTYTVSKEDLSGLKIFNADAETLSLSVNIQSTVITTYDPIVKTSMVTINSDDFLLQDSESFAISYNEAIAQLDGKTAQFELAGVPEEAVLTPSITPVNGIYTLTQSELENLTLSGIDTSFTLELTALIDDEIVSSEYDNNIETTIGETRTQPYMSIDELMVSSSTQDGTQESFSDAQDTIYSGGGNDEIYANGGNDTVYADASNGLVTVSFDLSSVAVDIKDTEKIVYTIETLPDDSVSNIGNIVNNKLIIEKDNFDGKLSLSYPYQTETLNLNVTTNIVDENDLNSYLFGSVIALSIEPTDMAGNDFIDSGDMNDIVVAGEGDDIILTQEGDDIVVAGSGNDYIDTSGGADRIDAGEGDDKIVMDSEDFKQNLFMNEIINGGEGYDTVIIKDDEGVTFDMSLTNVEGFIGGDGNDNVLGSANSDIVYGGKGADTYNTQGGDDIVYIDAQDIVGNLGTFVDTGSGYDKIYIDDSSDVEFDVAQTNAEEIISGSGNDILKNSTNEEVTIYGMDGNDRIYVSDSKDILDGGDGIDTLDFSNSDVGINIDMSTNKYLGGYAQNDIYTNFENIIGTQSDDTIVGDASDNIIHGKDGNNEIDGNGGFNTAVFDGRLIDYFNNGVMDSIITTYDRTATVFTSTGINELTNIDVLQFDDYKVYIDGTVNAPFVYEETIEAVEDTPITINTSDLLANDFSLDNSNLTIVGINNSENGIAQINEDGTITFTPYKNYNSSTNNIFDQNSALYKGEARFEYIVEDEQGNRSTAYTTVNVEAVNDAPTISSHSFYRRSYYTGRGKIIIEDVDSNVSSIDIDVVSNLTYTTTGRPYISGWDFTWNSESGDPIWTLKEFTRKGYVNINGRTPDEDGIFYFDYRGSYIAGHHYNTGRVDVFDMRPFTLSISDDGDVLTGENIQTITLNTGKYYHRLRSDPVILDLDGDGIELEDRYYSNFDDTMIGVGSDDAVLVWDIDQDGTISSELESNWVSLSDGATNDLQVLRDVFDTNADGLFNKDDERWSEFALWQDKNADGLVSEDEFAKISESGIEELILEQNEDLNADYPIIEFASYLNKDGDIFDMASAYLDTTTTNEKLSDEDILLLQQAAQLNEQLASTALSEEDETIVVVESIEQDDNEFEEYIA